MGCLVGGMESTGHDDFSAALVRSNAEGQFQVQMLRNELGHARSEGGVASAPHSPPGSRPPTSARGGGGRSGGGSSNPSPSPSRARAPSQSSLNRSGGGGSGGVGGRGWDQPNTASRADVGYRSSGGARARWSPDAASEPLPTAVLEGLAGSALAEAERGRAAQAGMEERLVLLTEAIRLSTPSSDRPARRNGGSPDRGGGVGGGGGGGGGGAHAHRNTGIATTITTDSGRPGSASMNNGGRDGGGRAGGGRDGRNDGGGRDGGGTNSDYSVDSMDDRTFRVGTCMLHVES